MKARVGGWYWLLCHDLRVMARESHQFVSKKRMLWTLLTLQLLIGSVTALVVWLLSKHPVPASRVIDAPMTLIYFLLLGGFVFSSAIKGAVISMFDGGDIELLLASPVPSRSVFVVRLLRVAAGCGFVPALILLPIANVAAAMGHPRLLAVYPALAALLLTWASLALLLTVQLVRWLGARKARLVAQLAAVFCGTGTFIALELPGMLSDPEQQRLVGWINQALAPQGWLGNDSLLRYPLRAAWGEPLPLLVVAGVAAGVTSLAIWLLGRQFSAGVLVAQSESPKKRRRSSASARFSASLARNVLVKEWRLIYRDPYLLSRILRQIIFLIPGVWIFLFKHGQHSPVVQAWLVGGTVLFLSVTLSASLSWLTVCGEDAPELLGSAPVASDNLKRYKVLAAVLPLWIPVAPVAAVLWHRYTYPGICFTATFLLATWSTALLNVWLPTPGNRREFGRRKRARQPGGWRGFFGLVMLLLWFTTYGLLAKQNAWAGLSGLGAIGCAGLAWYFGQTASRRLAY